MLWLTAVVSIGLGIIGAAMILMATTVQTTLTDTQKRNILLGGVACLVFATFIPPLMLLSLPG